jgi:N-acetyl-anhydromuramyl-L-alanine amidase AmpD
MDKVQPTEKQIESCAHLVAYLCDEYEIPIDREHIVGHREVNDDTSCPGENLFAKMDLIVSKAAWYAKQDGGETDKKEEEWKEDMKEIQREITRYNTIEELPDWAKPTIQKLVDKKLLSGDGKSLDLSADMIRVFVVLDRNGTFD